MRNWDEIVCISYSAQGERLGMRLQGLLEGEIGKVTVCPYSPEKGVEDELVRCFSGQIPVIFICAAGIAVRKIASFLKSKKTDPAVLCIDDAGRFVIPLVSGHLGGANELAEYIAEKLRATAVVTTATDLRGKFAVDLFAQRNHLTITDMAAAKRISAAVLEGRRVAVFGEEVLFEEDMVSEAGEKMPELEFMHCLCRLQRHEHNNDMVKVVVSPYRYQWPEECRDYLHLVPRVLTLGIGCRKNVSKEAIAAVVEHVFVKFQLDIRAVDSVCSIDLKRDEKGLVEFCREYGFSFQTFSAAELSKVSGDFRHSDFVQQVTGVDNVCERSALAGGGRRLLVPRQAGEGVTVAVAVQSLVITCL